jgi:hypothetical protein
MSHFLELVSMTTFVSQQVRTAAPVVDAGRLVRALTSVREWSKDYAGAVRASAATPRPEGMDPQALLVFGRS